MKARTFPKNANIQNIMKATTRLLIVSSLALATGCLRYTPSYKELQAKYEKGPVVNEPLGGPQEFSNYEKTLTNRLNQLLQQRASLVTTVNSNQSYPLGYGDLLAVDVYGFTNLSAQSIVSPEGAVSLPLIGKTSVSGMTVEQAREHLSQRYAHFIRSPQVQVSLKNPQASRVSVMGEVTKPGLYPLNRRGVLLTEILSEAGGRTPAAGTRIILLPAPRLLEEPSLASVTPAVTFASTDQPDGDPHHENDLGVEIDLEDLTGQMNRRPLIVPLMPGDTVIIPEAGNYEVDGEVVEPGSYKISSRTSVIGAIAAAKGFTYAAAVNNVEIIRDTGGGKKALVTLDLEEVGLRGGQDIRLRNGDLVRVPSEPNRFFKRQIVAAINSIFNGVGANKRIN